MLPVTNRLVSIPGEAAGADLDDDDHIVGREGNAALFAFAQQGTAPALLAAELALLGEGRRFLCVADPDRVVFPERHSRRIVAGRLLDREIL